MSENTVTEPASSTPVPAQEAVTPTATPTQDPLPGLLARIEALEADIRGRTGLPEAGPVLLARVNALESDLAQSKAKVQEALGKLLAEPPTL